MYSLKEFIIFFAIVLSVYFLSNFYIYKRGVKSLALSGKKRWIFRILFLLVVLSYPLGRVFEGLNRGGFINYPLILAGSIWMGMMLYLILFILLIDLLRLLNRLFGIFPAFITKDRKLSSKKAFYTVVTATLVITAYGMINAGNPKIFEVDVELKKLNHEKNPFIITQVSDVHFGKLISHESLYKIADEVNSTDADIIVITGDLVDDGSADLDELVKPLSMMNAKHGKYFITGNHDYFGNAEAVNEKVSASGFKVLRNEYEMIDSSIILLGLDYLYCRKAGTDNRAIPEMLRGADPDLPVVVLKHVPDNLDKFTGSGVDLLLSGHTHHGQLFPFSLITDMVYEVSNGLGTYKDIQVYVNRGVGFWGPPMRVGVPSEITKIILKTKREGR